jgi:periplasmic divalent cation tolerance protein
VPAAEALVVLVTAAGREEAEALSRTLLDAHLCACVTILPQATSLFRWEGKVDVAQEALLVIKTTREALPALAEIVKRCHSYQVPEIIALPVVGGSEEYLAWLASETRPGRADAPAR